MVPRAARCVHSSRPSCVWLNCSRPCSLYSMSAKFHFSRIPACIPAWPEPSRLRLAVNTVRPALGMRHVCA